MEQEEQVGQEEKVELAELVKQEKKVEQAG